MYGAEVGRIEFIGRKLQFYMPRIFHYRNFLTLLRYDTLK